VRLKNVNFVGKFLFILVHRRTEGEAVVCNQRHSLHKSSLSCHRLRNYMSTSRVSGLRLRNLKINSSPFYARGKLYKSYIHEFCYLNCECKLYALEKKTPMLSPRANYTDRATAACRRSDCQLLRIEGATWSA
jgi:hypothetical protein